MKENIYSGNDFSWEDELSSLLELKKVIMKNLNVAEVCKVEKVNENEIKCKLLNSDNVIICDKLKDLVINKDDIVLVVFTDTDFRLNLKKEKLGKVTQIIENDFNHDLSYGIIIGIIYKKEV